MNVVVTHNNKIDVTSGVTVVSSSENKIDVTSGVTVVYSSPMNVVVAHNNKIDVTSGVAVVPSSKFATTLTTILVATGIVLGYQNIEVPITEPITEPVTVDTGVNVDFVHQYAYSDTVHVMGHVSPDTGHKIQLNHTDVLTITSGVETFIYEIPDTVEDIEVTSNIEAADGVTVEIDEPADTISVYGQVTAVGMHKGSTRGRIAYYKDGRTDKLHYVIGMLNDTPVLGYGLRIGINNLPNDINVDSGVEVGPGLPIIDDLTTDVTVTGYVDVAPPIVKATADWVDVDVYSNVDAVLKPELDIVYDSIITVVSSSDFEYGHDHYIARTEYVDVLTDVGIMYTPPIIDTELIDVTSVVSANYIHHNIPTDQTINTISAVESVHTPTTLYNDVLEQISVTTGVVSVTIVLTPTDTNDIVVTAGVDTFFINPVESVNDAVVLTSGTDVLFITPITHVDTVETSSKVTADFIEINVDNDEVITVDSGTDVQVFAPIVYESIVTTLTGIDHSYGEDNYIERTESLTTSTGIDVAPTPPYEDDAVVTVSSVIDVVYGNEFDVEYTHIIDTISDIDTIVFAPVEDVEVIDVYTGIDIHYGIDSYLERTEVVTVSNAIDFMYILSIASEVVIDVLSQVAIEIQDLLHTSTDTINVSDAITLMENTDILPTTVEIAVNSGIDTYVIGAYDDATLIDVYSNVDVDVVDTDVEIDVDVIETSSIVDVMVTPPVEHIDTVNVMHGIDTQYGVDSYIERTETVTVSGVINLEYGLNTDIITTVVTTSQVMVEVTDLDAIAIDTVDVNTSIEFIENRDIIPTTIDIMVDSGVTTHIISSYNSDTVVDVDSNVDAQVIDNNIDAITDNVVVDSDIDITVLPPVDYTDTVDTLSGIDIQYGYDNYLERTDDITVSSAMDIMYVLDTSDVSVVNVISQVVVEVIDLDLTPTDIIDVSTDITVIENKDILPTTTEISVDSSIDIQTVSPYSSDTVVDVVSGVDVETIDIDVDTTTDSIETSSIVDVMVTPPVDYIDIVDVLSGIDTQYGVDSYLERTEAVTVSSAIDLMYILSTTTTESVDTTSQVIVEVIDLDVTDVDIINISTDVAVMGNKDMLPETIDVAVDSLIATHIISPYSSDTIVVVDSSVTAQTIDIDVDNTTDDVITSSAIGVTVLPPVGHTDTVDTLSGIDTQYGVDSYLERTDVITVSGAIGLMYVLNTADDSDINVVSQVLVDTIDLYHTSTDDVDVDTSITLMENTNMFPVTVTVTVNSGIDVLIVSPYSGDNIVDVDSNITVQTIDNNIDAITDSIITSSTVGVATLPPVDHIDTVSVLSGADTQYGVDSYIERTEVVTVSDAIGVQVFVPISALDTVTVTTAIGLGYQPIISSANEVINVATQLLPMVIAVYDDTVNIAVSSGVNPAAGSNNTITHSDVVNVITAVNSIQGLNETVSTDTDIVVSSVVALELRLTTSTSDTIAVASGIAVEIHTMVVSVTDTINVTSGIGIHPPIDLNVPTADTVSVVTQLNPMIVLNITDTQTINVTSVVGVAWGSALSSSDVVTASSGMDMQVGVNSYIERTETVTATSGIGYTIQPPLTSTDTVVVTSGIDAVVKPQHVVSSTDSVAATSAISVEAYAPFNITLNKNGGSGGTSSITGLHGVSISPTSVSVPSRTGYTFQGYYTATSGGTQRINASGTYVALTNTTYSGNVTLYARWAANTYTITLDKQSGTGGTSSITSVYGTSLTPTSVTVPTRAGYDFVGYYNSTSGGTQRINASGTYVDLTSTTYSTNATLYARWALGTFSITLNQSGGSGASLVSSTYTHSTSYQTIPFAVYQSSRTGYTFQGWDVKWADGNNSEGKVAGQLISNGGIDLGELHLMQGVWGNLILEAVWSSNTYTITLNMNGGSGGTSSITSVYGTSLTPTSVTPPNRTGYDFAGYYTASSGGTQRINSSGTYVALTSTTYTSNATLYARWTRKTYTITLNKRNGTGGTNSIAGVYGSSLTPTSIIPPTRTGYIFQGYRTTISSSSTLRIDAGGNYIALTSTTYSANVTLQASWTAEPTQTATPTVSEPYCRNDRGSNRLIVSITNNDTVAAVIKRGAVTLGTLGAGATTTYNLYSGFSIPYSYTVSITATATGKPESVAVVKSGSVSLCPIQGI